MVLRALLLAIWLCSIVCLVTVNCKSFDYRFCYDEYTFRYFVGRECNTVRMRKNILAANPLEHKQIANGFLNKRIFTKRSSEPARGTTYHEECCIEGCTFEEVMEYC